MILHDGPSIGMDWARAAEPGDAIAIRGPRIVFDPLPKVEWLLLFGDDTALPAISVILEGLSENTSATVIIEVNAEADRQPLSVSNRISVTWLYRRGVEPGKTALLKPAVRSVIPDTSFHTVGAAANIGLRPRSASACAANVDSDRVTSPASAIGASRYALSENVVDIARGC